MCKATATILGASITIFLALPAIAQNPRTLDDVLEGLTGRKTVRMPSYAERLAAATGSDFANLCAPLLIKDGYTLAITADTMNAQKKPEAKKVAMAALAIIKNGYILDIIGRERDDAAMDEAWKSSTDHSFKGKAKARIEMGIRCEDYLLGERKAGHVPAHIEGLANQKVQELITTLSGKGTH